MVGVEVVGDFVDYFVIGVWYGVLLVDFGLGLCGKGYDC